MAYQVIDPEDIEPDADRPSDRRSISGVADLQNVGVNLYSVEPGEDVPYHGLHYHEHQEEIFYVVDGEIHVETLERTYQIDAGHFFVAKPQSPHRAFNTPDATDTATLLAVGAPAVDDDQIYEG